MPDTARALVEDVLSPALTKEIWTGNYDKALPVTLLGFEIPALLPAIFYMFRFGERRGAGRFLETFAVEHGTPAQRRRSATVERVSEVLASSAGFDGFGGEHGTAILGDLLLCHCLENVSHRTGRDQQLQRIGPAHYLASWLDLPWNVTDLRRVPEMVVALLANQDGEQVELSPPNAKSWFPVGRGYEDNVLLRPFSRGVARRGDVLGDRASDRFDERNEDVGLDQLVTIRLAAMLKSAPLGVAGKAASRISNQRPLAEAASRNFSDDLRRFLRAYSEAMPRHALVDMLEACIAVGMVTVLSSVVDILLIWSKGGQVPPRDRQEPLALLVDCSMGMDRELRSCSEQSADDFVRRVEQVPEILMALRLLDRHARANKKVEMPASVPYATDHFNLLGDLMRERHDQSGKVRYSMEEKAERLAEGAKPDFPEAAAILVNEDVEPNPVWRLARGLLALMNYSKLRADLLLFVDSSLMTGRPNGLGVKRKRMRGGRRRDVRSIALTDPVIEHLVHLHLLPTGNKPGVRKLAFGEFLEILRTRYGFCIDVAPPGMSLSNEVLQRNRALFERRLRDLGLLAGVNDAESMKRLRPRFEPAQGS